MQLGEHLAVVSENLGELGVAIGLKQQFKASLRPGQTRLLPRQHDHRGEP